MQKQFWQNKWNSNEIGFHQPTANPLLIKNIGHLNLSPSNRIFIPLCGKTLDIAWLLSQGFKVVGAEIIESAIIQLFNELELIPTVNELPDGKHYCAQDIDIYVGDILNLTQHLVGQIDAVYDRAALVALPEVTRVSYAKHIQTLSQFAPQLLITFEYHQTTMQGPPFSISKEELKAHYADNYLLNLLAEDKVQDAVKGNLNIVENIWHLDAKKIQ
ncbi:thiopurine S-methyltransferase [Paraglaciecola sp. L3A3]|uniref:thiopurine S-methyltransferase n=1 Tax=Paraglaciecola sp. L3A3 TaxID=2686358 RepID=UPI00131E76F3|nr:thiopurine S-methyltransferase [Paraglaciecola sp. L3A3]